MELFCVGCEYKFGSMDMPQREAVWVEEKDGTEQGGGKVAAAEKGIS